MDNWNEHLKVDRHAKIPLYHQIADNFRNLIITGQVHHGESVPSEWELSELYGVSRLTVRQALGELVREGWLTRQHGVGTFVAKPKVAQIVPSKLGFTHKMRQIGRVPSSQVVSLKVTASSPEVAVALGLEAESPVIEIIRVRLADGEPIMLETAYLPQARFPDLIQSNLGDGSLYEYLHDHYQVTVVSVDQTLEPTHLTSQDAHLLKGEVGAAAMLSEVIAFTDNGSAVDYSRGITRGDKCKFYFRFQEGELEKP